MGLLGVVCQKDDRTPNNQSGPRASARLLSKTPVNYKVLTGSLCLAVATLTDLYNKTKITGAAEEQAHLQQQPREAAL